MELENPKTEDPFYEDAAHYWEKIPATVDGMLGGFGYISQTDITGSNLFLQEVFNMKNPPEKKRALDCGAGIGRITKNLLMKIFDKVDMVEQNPAFLEQAKVFLTANNNNKLGELYPIGLQHFTPDDGKYDLIWCQWVMGHLKDDHFIEFLQRCQQGLKKNGIIVIKENITSSSKVEVDTQDSSVTRPLGLLRRLIKRSGLVCFKEYLQPNLPKGIFSVKIFGLHPSNEDDKFRKEDSIHSHVSKIE